MPLDDILSLPGSEARRLLQERFGPRIHHVARSLRKVADLTSWDALDLSGRRLIVASVAAVFAGGTV